MQRRRFESDASRTRPAPLDAGSRVDDTRSLRAARDAAPASRSSARTRQRRHAAADRAQSDRRRRHDPGQRLQPRGHADHAARVAGRLRHPAVVLVGGPAPADRDEWSPASRLRAARAGARRTRLPGPALRQARRRPERRTHRDGHARRTMRTTSSPRCSGWRSATTWTRGASSWRDTATAAAVALLAAAREKKIAALVLIAGRASPGADLILEQQQHLLDG